MFLNAASTGQFFYLVPFVVLFPVIGLLINIIFGGRDGRTLYILGHRALYSVEVRGSK